MPPTRSLQRANHNTTFNRIRGDQTNIHYGDINHISDSYNTTTTNNYGSDGPMVNNSDNNNLQNDWSEMSKSHERRITASRRQPLGYPLFKSPANHPAMSGREGDLAGWQQSYTPPLPPQNFRTFQPYPIPYRQSYFPPHSNIQALLEGYPHDPLPTPDISGLMRRNPTTAYNHVHGNQTNHYTYQNQFIEQNEKEHTIYDEYHKVISGDIYKLPDIFQGTDPHYSYSSGEYRIFKAKTMICHAEVQGRQGFTMVSYKGEDAKELWECDFRQFAEQGDARKMQLFGINRHSSIPFLIFHRELIPVAQIQDRIQDKMTCRLTGAYLRIISKVLGSSPKCIWLDAETGTLIHGTERPDPDEAFGYLSSITPPSNLMFLQKDVFWQYLLQLPKNQEPDEIVVVLCFWMDLELEDVTQEILSPDQCQPMVVSTLTNSPIAIGSAPWDLDFDERGPSKPERTMWQDGTTRFSFAGIESSDFSLFWGYDSDHMWLTQALSVFHHLRISLDEDLSQFGLIHSHIHLRGRFDCSHDKLQQHKHLQSFHLFIPHIPPFPLIEDTYVSGWHYWSFDPSGQTSISEDKCRELGLPTQLFLMRCSVYKECFPTETYKTIHRWQVEWRFDPKTTDFARYLYPKHPLFQLVIQDDSSHFTQLDDEDA